MSVDSKILANNKFELVTVKEDEIVEFVRNVQGTEHVLFLWTDNSKKNQFVSELFNKESSKGNKGFVSLQPYPDKEVENTVYEQFYNKHGKEFIPKAVDKVTIAVAANKTDSATRYAFEDDTWLMDRGQDKEVIETEEKLGPTVDEKLSLFCFNNVSKLNESKLNRMIPAHGYVITDKPLRLYKFKNLK